MLPNQIQYLDPDVDIHIRVEKSVVQPDGSYKISTSNVMLHGSFQFEIDQHFGQPEEIWKFWFQLGNVQLDTPNELVWGGIGFGVSQSSVYSYDVSKPEEVSFSVKGGGAEVRTDPDGLGLGAMPFTAEGSIKNGVLSGMFIVDGGAPTAHDGEQWTISFSVKATQQS